MKRTRNKKTVRLKKIARPRGGIVIKTRIRAGYKIDGTT
jgi:hypothetical protein